MEKCIEKQSQIAANAKNSLEEMQNAANEYGLPKDRYDSFRAQLLHKRDLFAAQYQQALADMETLLLIDPQKNAKKAEFGAVVTTEKQTLFISISLGKIELETGTVVAVSPKVPVFESIRDKKKGDYYVWQGHKIEILDVF